MRIVLFILLPLLAAACATRQKPPKPMGAHFVPGTTLPSEGVQSVRYVENIKSYPLGRYVDPNNSRIMHEEHSIYRVETSPKWNLHPSDSVFVPHGPVVHVRSSAKISSPVGQELIAELNRQKEATKTVIQGGQTVSQKLGELTTSLQQTQQVAAQNAQLKQEVNTTKQRLDALEEQLRKQAQNAPAPLRSPARGDDKAEW